MPIDPELVQALYKPSQWAVTPDPAEHNRRSVYLFAKRNLRLPFMEVFDAPDAQVSCPRRESSTHAPQALELLNGDFSNRMAEAFAARLESEAGKDHARQVDLAYRLASGRAPNLEGKAARTGVPQNAASAGVRSRDVQPQRISLRELICRNTLALPARAANCCRTPAAASAAWLSLPCSRGTRAPHRFNPLAPKAPHMPDKAKAKSVIFLFMAGGPSHMDTFDPKPLLNQLDGQPRPEEFGEAKYQFVKSDAKLLGSKRTFKKYGQSGIEVSDLFPHLAQCVDDHRGDPLLSRRHGGALGRAVPAFDRPHYPGVSEHGRRGSSTDWDRRASRCRATS